MNADKLILDMNYMRNILKQESNEAIISKEKVAELPKDENDISKSHKENEINRIFQVMKKHSVPSSRKKNFPKAMPTRNQICPSIASKGYISNQLIEYYNELKNQSIKMLRKKRRNESCVNKDISQINLKKTEFDINLLLEKVYTEEDLKMHDLSLRYLYVYQYKNSVGKGNDKIYI